MEHQAQKEVHVSSSFRFLENGHILLWLIKDTCWATIWRPGGIFMIFPTMGMAIFILWKARHVRAELFHNLAVCLWIAANSVWMVGEFFDWDTHTKPVAVAIFFTGLFTLAIYYLFFFRKERMKEKQYALSVK